MDLRNELSCEVALAVFGETRLGQKLDVRNAKSFIELIEAELTEISREDARAGRTVLGGRHLVSADERQSHHFDTAIFA